MIFLHTEEFIAKEFGSLFFRDEGAFLFNGQMMLGLRSVTKMKMKNEYLVLKTGIGK